MLAALKKKGRVNMPDTFYEQFEEFNEVFMDTNKLDGDTRIFISRTSDGRQEQEDQTSVESNFLHQLNTLLTMNGFQLKLLDDKLQKTEILEPLPKEQELVLQREDLPSCKL